MKKYLKNPKDILLMVDTEEEEDLVYIEHYVHDEKRALERRLDNKIVDLDSTNNMNLSNRNININKFINKSHCDNIINKSTIYEQKLFKEA